MCGLHVNLLLGFCIKPSAHNATAWEHEHVCALPIKYSELKIMVERCSRHRKPLGNH